MSGRYDGPEMRVCDTCRHFGPQLDDASGEECGADGACRRRPPELLPAPDLDGYMTLFPPVNREDWCGKWKRKDEVI